MNPFMLGLTALAGAQNPALMSSAMATAGVDPEQFANTMSGGFEAFSPGPATGVPGTMLGTPTAAMQGTPIPEAAAGAVPGTAGAAPGLSALQGVKTPQPPKPVFNAGVRNAQQAPNATGGQSANVLQLFQQMMGGGGVPAPNLGALLGG